MEPEKQSIFKALTGPKPQTEKKILLWAEYISKTRFDMYPSIHHDMQQQNVTGRKRWCYCLNHIINLTSSLQKNTSMNSHWRHSGIGFALPCYQRAQLPKLSFDNMLKNKFSKTSHFGCKVSYIHFIYS